MTKDEPLDIIVDNASLDTDASSTPDETAQETEHTAPELSIEELTVLCQERICPGCDVFKEAEDIRLRALAELENTKSRLARERSEQVKYAAEAVLASLLPTLDNLDLALQYGASDPACKNTVVGVEMTRKLFLEALATHGLYPVGEVGEAFDPALHEAVGQEEQADTEPGVILHVMQRGYQLKERLLRPAKVTVST